MEEKFHLSYNAKDIDARLKKVDDIPYKVSELENDKGFITSEDIPQVELPDNIATLDDLAKKQDIITDLNAIREGAMLGATAIQEVKTINGESIEGSGNIVIEGGSGSIDLSNYATKEDLATKQDVIEDLDFIKEGANKGATALQTIPSEYITESELAQTIATKQDKLIEGEGISIEGNTISCTHDKTLYKVVTELPAVGEEHKIYLIVSTEQEDNNIYNEWGYINGKWEMLGTYKATIDLTPYALKTEIPTKTSQLENDSNFATIADIPATETYVLNFTIQDGVNTGAYDATEYANLRAAIQAGKLIIIGGTVTRVTADSQAMAADYVVIRYSTPRIGDDNKTITISFYELKFSATEYTSKAIHRTLS